MTNSQSFQWLKPVHDREAPKKVKCTLPRMIGEALIISGKHELPSNG
jgi:hypothetical protein